MHDLRHMVIVLAPGDLHRVPLRIRVRPPGFFHTGGAQCLQTRIAGVKRKDPGVMQMGPYTRQQGFLIRSGEQRLKALPVRKMSRHTKFR